MTTKPHKSDLLLSDCKDFVKMKFGKDKRSDHALPEADTEDICRQGSEMAIFCDLSRFDKTKVHMRRLVMRSVDSSRSAEEREQHLQDESNRLFGLSDELQAFNSRIIQASEIIQTFMQLHSDVEGQARAEGFFDYSYSNRYAAIDGKAACHAVQNCALSIVLEEDEALALKACSTKENALHDKEEEKCEKTTYEEFQRCKSACPGRLRRWFSRSYLRCRSSCEEKRKEQHANCLRSAKSHGSGFALCILESCMESPYGFSNFLWYPWVNYELSSMYRARKQKCGDLLR